MFLFCVHDTLVLSSYYASWSLLTNNSFVKWPITKTFLLGSFENLINFVEKKFKIQIMNILLKNQAYYESIGVSEII